MPLGIAANDPERVPVADISVGIVDIGSASAVPGPSIPGHAHRPPSFDPVGIALDAHLCAGGFGTAPRTGPKLRARSFRLRADEGMAIAAVVIDGNARARLTVEVEELERR